MRRERLGRALLLLASLVVSWGVAELTMAARHPRHLSQLNRLSRAPGAGLGDLVPGGPLPYRLERMRVEAGELWLDMPDGPERYSLKKTARPRVIALGDSLTELWNLSGYRNWVSFTSARLARTTPGIEVVPVGVGGYNTAHEAALLTGELAELDGDVLLLQMCPNDAEVLYLHQRSTPRVTAEPTVCETPDVLGALRAQTLAEEFLWPRFEAIGFDCRERTFDRFWGSRVLWAIDHARNRPEHDDAYGTRLVEATPAQRQALERLAAFASRKGMPLLAVLFPLFADRAQIELELFRRLLTEVRIPFLDLTPEFSRDRQLAAWRIAKEDPYHPNIEGHERAAEVVAERLVALGWLRPRAVPDSVAGVDGVP